jgi:hypothetical protein
MSDKPVSEKPAKSPANAAREARLAAALRENLRRRKASAAARRADGKAPVPPKQAKP